MEKLEALKIIGDIFRNNKIPFALIGAYASSAWGVIRFEVVLNRSSAKVVQEEKNGIIVTRN